MYLGSIAATSALTKLSLPHDGLIVPLLAIALCLVTLDFLRIAIRGKAAEARASGLCLPAVLVLTAWVIRETQLAGWPVYQGAIGPSCIALYAMLSGRDFSFVGCALLSFIASSAAVAGMASAGDFDRTHAAFALGTNGVFVLYVVYDLASLMARRRKGEELAAVVDLYRDIFNFFGYAVRIVKHWQKHRIWTVK